MRDEKERLPQSIKGLDEIAEDGLYLVNYGGKPKLNFNLHALSNYAKKHNLYPITQEVIDKARGDGAI